MDRMCGISSKVFRKYELGFQPNTDFTSDFETGIISWQPSLN
jgi:hypothetical protein